MEWTNILGDVLEGSQTPLKSGHAVICVWNDLSHYREWEQHNPNSPNVRIISEPVSQFPIITLTRNPRTVCVVGLGFSRNSNYSDLSLRYYTEVTL